MAADTLPSLNNVLSEIHRLRKHVRDLQAEIDGLPRLKKAHEAKVARHEKALKDAQDAIKQGRAATNAAEVSLKANHQQLLKYDKQMNDLKTPKEVEGKQKEIAATKAEVQKHEEEIFAGMTNVEEKVTKLPPLEEQVKKAKAEFAAFEADFKERQERLLREMNLAQTELAKVDSELPPQFRSQYDRLVKAHGPDALAAVNGSVCSQCHTSVTQQNKNELRRTAFSFAPPVAGCSIWGSE